MLMCHTACHCIGVHSNFPILPMAVRLSLTSNIINIKDIAFINQ